MSIQKKTLIPRIGVASLSSPLEVGADRAPRQPADLRRLLQSRRLRARRAGADRPARKVGSGRGRKLAESHVHAVVLVAASWFEDYLVFDLLEECPVPLLLWSLPGMETVALCGVQQLTGLSETTGRRLSGRVRAVGLARLPDACPRVSSGRGPGASLAAGADRIGRPSRRRHERGGGQRTVAEKGLGPRVVPLDLPQLLAAAQEVPDQQADSRGRKSPVAPPSARCRKRTASTR